MNAETINKIISLLSGLLVLFLAIAAFILSYEALRDLALQKGVKPSLAFLYPAIIDGAVIVFSLSVLKANLDGKRGIYPWILVGSATILSVVLNIVHAPADFLARVLAAVPPLALFLSFEMFLGQIKSLVEQTAIKETFSQMQQILDKRTADIRRQVQTEKKQLQALIEQGKQAIEQKVTNNEQTESHLAHSYEQALTQLEMLFEEIEQAKQIVENIHDEQPSANVHSTRKESAMQSLLQFLEANPQASMDEAGLAIGRAKSTVHNYIRELQESHLLTKNGHGWEVSHEI